MTINKEFLSAESISFSYGTNQILYDITFKLGRGEHLSIIGPNGSGKSTLMSVLSGFNKPSLGKVLLNSSDVHSMQPSERALSFAVIHQKESANFPFNCFEMVQLGLYPFLSRFSPRTKAQNILTEQVMKRVGIFNLSQKSVTEISGGQFQRVVIARAIMQQPKLLFMDEAMSELDVGAKIEITNYLSEISREKGMSVVQILHDLSLAYRRSDKVLILKDGHNIGCGCPHEIMSKPFFADVFNVDAEIIGERGFLIHDNIKNKYKENYHE